MTTAFDRPAGRVTLEDKVAWLSTPAAYPDHPARVDRIQTHFAWVFLTDTRAWKLKKPQRIYGADLRSIAERARCCREELRLNRRLAADTYLAVHPIVLDHGVLRFDAPGEIVDWVVEMRRLEASGMLGARLRAGTVTVADLRLVIGRLRSLDPVSPPLGLTPAEFIAGLERRLEEALREIARPEFRIPEQAWQPQGRALASLVMDIRPELNERAALAREGHGDLRAEHVWLGDDIQIIDALEFDRELRVLDPAEDVAMLALDTERIAGSWTRLALCTAWEELAADPVPQRVWCFYLALRALTRAKVALWHLDDALQYPEPEPWRARALEYLRLAAEYLHPAQGVSPRRR